MPNWCSNTLTLTGISSDLDQFKKENAESPDKPGTLSLAASVPRPVTQEDNWYDWNCVNWGTKWDVDAILQDKSYTSCTSSTSSMSSTTNLTESKAVGECDDRERSTSIVYWFDSAWSPPTPWVFKVSKLYPAIKFNLRYDEPGIDFGGQITVCNGECINEEEWKPSDVAKNSFYLELIKLKSLDLDPYHFYDAYSNKLLTEKLVSKFKEDATLISETIEKMGSECEMDHVSVECFQNWYYSYLEEWYEKISDRKLDKEIKDELQVAAIEMNHRPLMSGFYAAKEEYETYLEENPTK